MVPSNAIVRATLLAAVLTGAFAGCTGIDGASPDQAATTSKTTTSYEPASAQIMDVLDASPQVAAVLVNETYAYERGCYDGTDGTASAYIRTGFHYESTGDSAKEAVGGRLYLVRMNVTTDTVTALEQVESVPERPTC